MEYRVGLRETPSPVVASMGVDVADDATIADDAATAAAAAAAAAVDGLYAESLGLWLLRPL